MLSAYGELAKSHDVLPLRCRTRKDLDYFNFVTTAIILGIIPHSLLFGSSSPCRSSSSKPLSELASSEWRNAHKVSMRLGSAPNSKRSQRASDSRTRRRGL